MLDRTVTSLAGRVAIVTGGGAGIGRGIAEGFAAHDAAVVIAECDGDRARDAVAAIEAKGGRALASVVDVRVREQVDAMTEAVLREFGQVDILVNNVGDFLGETKDFVRSNEASWEALYEINLKHVFHCCHSVVPTMIERASGGAIINVSTIEAFRGIPGNAVYSAFNAAITGFTKSLALELARHQIRVNAIAPETTDTPQVPVERWIPEEHKDRIPYWIPLGRFGRPEDAAGCALFLASDLSAWVTGTTIHLDGGSLAAGGFYRVPGGGWTNMPIVEGAGIGGRRR